LLEKERDMSLLGGIGGVVGGVIGGPGGAAVGATVGNAVSGQTLSDQQKQQIDLWYNEALTGNAAAEAMLRCMSKVGRPQDEQLLRANPPQPPLSGTLPWLPADCFTHGWAQIPAQQYGQQKVAELERNRPLGSTIAAGLTGVGPSGLPNWVPIVVVLAIAFFVFKRGS
jgi:hypothetical protein